MDELNKLEEKKQALHKDIEFYGVQLEAIKKAIAEAEQKTADIALLNSALADLSEQKKQLQDSIVVLSTEEKKLASEIDLHKQILLDNDTVVQQLNESRAILAEIITEINLMKSEQSSFEAKNSDLKKEGEFLIEKNNALETSHKNRMEECDREFAQKKIALETELQELLNKKDALYEQNEVLEQTQIAKTEELNLINADILTAQKALESLDNTYAQRKAEQEKELSNMSAETEARAAALEKRDGELSLKEQALETKRGHLVTAKQRFERETGRTIALDI